MVSQFNLLFASGSLIGVVDLVGILPLEKY